MNINRFAFACLIAGTFAGVPIHAQDKEAVKALQGRWQVTKMIKRGELMADDRFRGLQLVFDGDKMTILGGRGTDDRRSFTFKINAKKMPGEIDLTAEDGTFKGQTAPGIYRFDGGDLILCLPHDDNKTRPDAFESLGGVAPSRILWTLKRPKD